MYRFTLVTGTVLSLTTVSLGQSLTIDDSKLSHAAYCLGIARYVATEDQTPLPAEERLRHQALLEKLNAYVSTRAFMSNDVALTVAVAQRAGARDMALCTAVLTTVTKCLKNNDFSRCDLDGENRVCAPVLVCGDIESLY